MKERIATLPCALCGRLLDQRADKNSKPYFVCEPCGTQFFIRGAAGRERLLELLRRSKANTAEKDAGVLVEQLEQLQVYIETFYDDELVIPGEDLEIEDAVPFAKWSREVCDRVLDELDRCANRT